MSTPQNDILEFLSSGNAFGLPDHPVDRHDTHISSVFLVDGHAYKLKRAVALPYLDFSTLEKRRKACEAEVRINRRTAPELYEAVVPVTREADGGLHVDGTGEPVEWLVRMRRFEQECMLDRIADRGGLNRRMIEALADQIFDLHQSSDQYPADGGAAVMKRVADSNLQSFVESSIVDEKLVNDLASETEAELERVSALLDQRRDQGFVRHCHGDLHLRNIVMLDGSPTLFDAIEFNDDFARIDVLYDLGFLLMDLEVRGQRRLANIALNRYLARTGDIGGLACLPLFMSMRAAVRGHVAALAARNKGAEDGPEAEEATQYVGWAQRYLKPVVPRLVAVGGLSGSGKSRLAREISPHFGRSPGAVIARSDAIRKRLAGIHPEERLSDEHYGAQATIKTFEQLNQDLRTALAAGYSAVGDAVFAQAAQREAVEAIAPELKVPFDGLWLSAPAEVMAERVASRRGNMSDATTQILEMQLKYDLGNVSWTNVDSSGSRENTIELALNYLGLKDPHAA